VGSRLPEAAFEAGSFTGDGWHLVAEGAAARAPHVPSAFVLGNGFIGIRGPGEAADAPRVYLNGVFEQVPIDYHEGAFGYARVSDTRLAVADASRISVAFGGVPVTEIGRITLDIRAGQLFQEIDEDGVSIRIERLVSFARSGVIATRITLTAGAAAGTFSVSTGVAGPDRAAPAAEGAIYDPRITPELALSPWHEERVIADCGVTGRVDRLARSGYAVAALVSDAPGDVLLAAGESRSIEIIAVYRAERGGEAETLAQAARADLAAAQGAGYAALAAEQADWLAAFWADADVSFPDNAVAEQALRHALFQLAQAAGRDGKTSVAAKGQTGEGYEGHVFWDADSYVLPVFVYTQPETARAMLAWRISKLAAARDNARAMGHVQGALYPWRSIDGHECSAFFPAGPAQYHINADIAYALKLYVETSGDTSILSEGGAEMLAETARIWLDAGYHDPARGGAFVINKVTGPDEYTALVDNNLYTNLMAAAHLRHAAAVAGAHLRPGEAEAMNRAADAMFLPMDDARGIYAQDDSFFAKAPWPIAETPEAHFPLLLHFHPLAIYRKRVCKQADAVLATVFLRDAFAPAMRERMLAEYEGVTVHDSTLSASAFACAAASVGDAAKAYRYWRVSLLTDLSNLFGNSDHGLHMAALAGAWNGLALGFGGLRTIDGRLDFSPIAVPDLGSYSFRIRFRGRSISVAVAGDEVSYRLLSGDPVALWHGGTELLLGRAPLQCKVVA